MTALPRLIDSRLEVSDRVAVLMLNHDDVRNELTALIDDIDGRVAFGRSSKPANKPHAFGTPS